MVEDGCRSGASRSPLQPVSRLFGRQGDAERFIPIVCVFKLSKVAPPSNVNEMASMLSKPELEKAEKLVAHWKPQPTALTLKAFSGFRAAEEHLKVAKSQVF